MRNIFALFKEYDQAETVIKSLAERNFKKTEMNVITGAGLGDRFALRSDTARDAWWGPSGPSDLSRFLSETLEVTIADVGRVRVAGAMARVLCCTAESQAPIRTGLKEALVDVRVPEELAEFYRSGVVEGGLLFCLRTTEGRVREARDLIARRTEV